MSEPKSKYSVGFGGYSEDGYEQLAEIGPYRTRFGAYIAMRRRLLKRFLDLPGEETLGWPYPLNDESRVLGASIERFTDDGTQETWDYNAQGELTAHTPNW